MQYRTTAGAVQAYSGISYYNLVVNANTLTFTLAANLLVAGSVTIQAGTTLDVTAANYSLTVGGNWTNSGTFTPRNGTVAFNPAQTTVLTGSATFYNLSCTTPGATLQFAAGSTQTIATGGIFTIAGANGTNILLRSTAASAYTIALAGTATASVTFADVQYSTATPGITATDSVNSGNNTGWTFTGTSYTWNGTTASWTTVTNWTPNGTPGANDAVVIPAGKSAYPLLTANLTVQTLTIQSGGTLDIASKEVTVNGTFVNQGTLRRNPMANPISNLTTDSYFNKTDNASGGTVDYYGAGTYIQDYGSTDYASITLDAVSPPSITLNYNLQLTGSLTISAGATLNVSATNCQIYVNGNWSNSGTFTAGTGTVYFLNAAQTSVISGNTSFYSLTCTAPGKTILFASGSAQTDRSGRHLYHHRRCRQPGRPGTLRGKRLESVEHHAEWNGQRVVCKCLQLRFFGGNNGEQLGQRRQQQCELALPGSGRLLHLDRGGWNERLGESSKLEQRDFRLSKSDALHRYGHDSFRPGHVPGVGHGAYGCEPDHPGGGVPRHGRILPDGNGHIHESGDPLSPWRGQRQCYRPAGRHHLVQERRRRGPVLWHREQLLQPRSGRGLHVHAHRESGSCPKPHD